MMELVLSRVTHPNGTNGKLSHCEQIICFCIELPWLQNRANVSCIPEGWYQITKRFTEKRSWHMQLQNVPERKWILFHPANHALTELEGCIAPVSKVTGPGEGQASKAALQKLEALVFDALDEGEDVFITIKKEIKMNVVKRIKAPTPKFFRVLRNIGVTLAAAGGAIMASPIALPAAVVSLAGYLVVGGGVLTAVSQTTVDQTKLRDE